MCKNRTYTFFTKHCSFRKYWCDWNYEIFHDIFVHYLNVTKFSALLFQAGFSQCANEVCTFLVSLPGLNSALGSRLLEHLKHCISKHRTPYPMVPSAVDHPVHVNSPKPLQVSVVSSQRFSPPLSPSPASSIESPVRSAMPSQKQFLPYKDVLHSSPPSPPAHPEDLSTQESNSMWRPW